MTRLTLVRNPNYNAEDRQPQGAGEQPRRFEFTVDSNIDDIYNKIGAGELDDEYATASPKVFREYSTSASKRKYLHSNCADGTYYITMNLTQAPFDDVHVRKAMNWIIDRDALTKAWGGAVSGVAAGAHHSADGAAREACQLPPVQDSGQRGQPRRRRRPRWRSRSTRLERRLHGQGVQGRAADHRRSSRGQADRFRPSRRTLRRSASPSRSRSVNGAYPVIQTTSKNIPISTRPRWFKDFADASTFIDPLFNGTQHHPER